MTLSEFKAWFEGYTEGLEGAPTKAQFERIKEKVKEIQGTVPTSYPIFVDRWAQPYRRYWDTYWTSTGGTLMGRAQGLSGSGYASNATLAAKGDAVTEAFDPQAAFYALGKAEAQAA